MVASQEIKYHDIVQSYKEQPLKMFPVINVTAEDGTYETLLVCRYETGEGPGYVVIGKFLPDKLPTSTDFTCLKWFIDLERLLEGIDAVSFRDYLEQLCLVKNSSEMGKILFTQEGYDLLSGKFHFLADGTIQRTVGVDMLEEEEGIMFGNSYYSTNHDAKMDHIGLFDTWGKFEREYFLNKKDLANMLPGDEALLYAVLNKDRLFCYIRDNYSKGSFAHNIDLDQVAPEDVAKYSLQLLDVVTDFQLEHNQTVGSQRR